jgi:hypothetical protein
MDKGTRFHATDAQRATVKALISFGHTQKEIANYFDISTHTLRDHFEAEIKTGKLDLVLLCGNYLVDLVGSNLASDKDRFAAARFILSTQCGWVEKKEVTAENTAIVIRDSINEIKQSLNTMNINKDVEKNDGTPR